MPEARTTLRVLLAAPASTGGIAAHVAMLAAGLADRGHRVTVAAPAVTLSRVPEQDGIERTRLDLAQVGHAARTSRRFRELARGHDLTHAHGVRVGAQAATVRIRPLVVTWHNAPIGGHARAFTHAALERISARGSNVVFGASADLVERARRAGARDAVLCEVAAPDRSTRRGELQRPAADDEQRRPLVLAVARLHPQKRLDLLIEATAGWARRPDGPRVWVAGDGPLADQLRTRAARVGSSVEFLGPRDDVADLLAEADVVVLSSDWEARPLVAQEALRLGVPLVATRVGGIPGLVGDAAELVPPGDAVALRAAIEGVLADATAAARLRAAGPRRAAGWPTAQQMVERIEQKYLDLISR